MRYPLQVALRNLFTQLGESCTTDNHQEIAEVMTELVTSEYQEELLDAVEAAGFIVEKVEN